MADAMTPESAQAVTTIYSPLSEADKARARRMIAKRIPDPAERAQVEAMLGMAA
ncbi:hypothetical protein [Microbacterium sp. 22242]|uniref:hypothetical protein n=1 Tax=Microbacterium sp. 22242 TaxID=3453896 RepID=UPI003F87F92C